MGSQRVVVGQCVGGGEAGQEAICKKRDADMEEGRREARDGHWSHGRTRHLLVKGPQRGVSQGEHG